MPLLNSAWREMVHDYAQRENIRYEVGGDFLTVRFQDDDKVLILSLYCTDDFLSISMGDDQYIPDDAFAVALAAANRFNNEYKIPKMYVFENDSGKHDFRGEWHVPANIDIDQRSFDEVLKWALIGLGQMFEWLEEQYRL